MRTRSEWFLAGDVHGGSLELHADSDVEQASMGMHLRPPTGPALTVAGIGTYRSHDDLTHYRNDDFMIHTNSDNDFVVASYSSILSSPSTSLSLLSSSSLSHSRRGSVAAATLLPNHNNHTLYTADRRTLHVNGERRRHHEQANGSPAVMFLFTMLDVLF